MLAMLNVPKNDNSGQPIPHVLTAAVAAVVAAFGGATITEGHGSWNAPDGRLVSEPVHVITVAYTDGTDSEAKLTAIAERVAIDAQQEAVFLARYNASVDFVTVRNPLARAA